MPKYTIELMRHRSRFDYAEIEVEAADLDSAMEEAARRVDVYPTPEPEGVTNISEGDESTDGWRVNHEGTFYRDEEDAA